MTKVEKDSRGYPIEFIKLQTQWYMKHMGYSELRAKIAAEVGYDLDMTILRHLNHVLKSPND